MPIAIHNTWGEIIRSFVSQLRFERPSCVHEETSVDFYYKAVYSKRFDLVETRLTEACRIVCYYSTPPYIRNNVCTLRCRTNLSCGLRVPSTDGSSITILILPSSWIPQEPGLSGGWWEPATKEQSLNTSYILIPDPRREGFRNNKIGRKIQNDLWSALTESSQLM